MRTFALTLIACLLPVAAMAQQESSGMYVTIGPDVEITDLGSGRSTQHATYGQFTTTDDEGDLFANQIGECTGTIFFVGPDTAGAGAGSCFNRDPEGNAYWFWWRMDESGTERCPISCGTFGVISGVGDFEGVTGTGTWETMAQHSAFVSSGRWTLTWKRD